MTGQDLAHRTVVADRYRVEQELGHGGMARVYRVVDARTDRRYALKKLVSAADRPASAQAMFEQEFHTLAGLAHPNIVRVFEYGVDDEGPFYTMELLDGGDARVTARSAQLTTAQVCLLLRDAAAALSLVHSRRMLHRDLSPRNLFCGADGRAKLIDFGTLAPMGAQSKIAGTPPFVPPEAVYMQPLDARSDIYALGALGYYLLTRRNAYPARQMRELRSLWQRRPKPPSALRPDIPGALSDLVMAMLSLDPLGRPASAADVYDRLTSIGELPIDDERKQADAFLITPTLVARQQERAFVRARLLGMLRGRGNTFAIVSAPGLGRSRLLSNVVLDAKVMGALAISVDAAAVHPTPYGLAIAIAERILEHAQAVPSLPAEAAAVLATFSPKLARAFGTGAAVDPGVVKRKTVAAWHALFQATAKEQPLVLAIDDVPRADGPSLALISQLATGSAALRVVVAVSCDASLLLQASPALLQLVKPDNRIELDPLSREQTRELLGSLFGAVPGLDDASRYLHEIALGSPRASLQYAQYLVDQRIARYEAGAWKLPERLRDHALPTTLSAMLERRVQVLSKDAFSLGLALALARDETRAAWQAERNVHVEDLPRLLPPLASAEPLQAGESSIPADSARVFAALGELVRAGFVERRDPDYVLTQTAIADALVRVASEDARKRAHARLAGVFGGIGYTDPVIAIRHLQAAGEYESAHAVYMELAEDSAQGTVAWSFDSMRVSVSAAAAQRQLTWWEAQRGSPRDGTILRRFLITCASIYDWSLARCGDAHLERLFLDLGFAHWEETDAALPPQERLAICMQHAQREHSARPRMERGSSPAIAVRELPACGIPLSGALVNSHDLERTRALAARFKIVRTLSASHELVADLCDLAVDRVTGGVIGDRPLGCLQRLFAMTEFPDVLRLGAVAVYMHVQALEDARSGRKRALELMDGLAVSAGDSLFIVVHGRWLGHAFRGESAQARKHREQLDLTTEDDAWRRRAYLFVEAQLHALTGDLPQLKRTAAAIAEIVDKFEGWRPWLMYCLAHVHALHGELEEARATLEGALELARPGEHRAYGALAPAHAELLLALGRPSDALARAERIARAVREHRLDPMAAIAADRVQALACSALARHDEALEHMRDALAGSRALLQDGLPLAQLYAAQARVAFAAGDIPEGIEALSLLRERLEGAEAPALLRAYEALREESGQRLRSDPSALAQHGQALMADIAPLPAPVDTLALGEVTDAGEGAAETHASPHASRSTLAFAGKALSQAVARIGAAEDRATRARYALELLLSESGCRGGHLFLCDASGIVAAASIELESPDDELLTWAQRYLEIEVGHTRDPVVTTHEHLIVSTPPPAPSGVRDALLVPCILADNADGRSMFVGLVLLEAASGVPRALRGESLRVLSRRFLDAGDAVPFSMDA